MNVRWEMFRTGAAMVIRTVRARRGHRVVVVDREMRARHAIAAMAGRGYGAREIATLIGRPVEFVRRELDKSQL